MHRASLGLVVAVVTLTAPGVAQAATTFCVHQGGSCPAGQTDEGGDLQHAFDDAASTDANTVSIGPGTYQRVGAALSFAQTTKTVTIVGAGADQTLLEEPAAGGDPVLTFIAAAGSTLSGVGVVAVGTQTALDARDIAVSHVAITADGNTTAASVSLNDSTLADSTVAIRTSAQSLAVRAATGASHIVRTTIVGPSGIGIGPGASAEVDDANVQTSGTAIGAGVGASSTQINDSVLALLPTTPSNQRAVYVADGSDVTLRSVTLLGVPTATGIVVSGDGGLESSLTVQDSILRGFGTDLTRQLADATPGSKASATLDHNDVHLGSDSGVAGTHSYNPGTEVDLDPGFVDAAHGDYRLRFDSPLIDIGGLCGMSCQTIPDLDGLTRPIDGKGTGTAVRDLGAYEYGRRAPTTTVAATTTTAVPGQVVGFSAAGTDLDHGDAITYAWAFDDGAVATGPNVDHAFSTDGVHVATVTVTDSTGLTGSASATVAVPAPAAPPAAPVVPPVRMPAAPKDKTPPVLSRLSLIHTHFAVSAASTVTSARVRKPPKGTAVHFTLSESATATLKVEAESRGVRSGKRCIVPPRTKRRSTHSPKPCTRYTSRGTLTRKHEKAGADTVAFSGRIGRKALAKGHYRLTAKATDAAGNASRPKTATFVIV
jgi:PKD repeat protein